MNILELCLFMVATQIGSALQPDSVFKIIVYKFTSVETNSGPDELLPNLHIMV